ncbi:flagellar basal body rod C-terminal domain-containing protein, partial [Aquabacterium sp. A08]|uniref:flagellar basal body rod C-terminal domain-containing protein n=1 Tax=Aquabacterium sp. A08 TaxID=2718532 RepID=UPI0027386353
PAWANTVVTFGANGQYSLETSDGTTTTTSGPFNFVSGQPIRVEDPSGFRLFELTLRGVPAAGDRFTVRPPVAGESMAQNTGNGQALLALRDANALDGYTLSDGYIPVFSAVASSIQSAQSAATFATQVAQAAEAARANQSGVNLDEEAARLLQYQQAYQAAAKYLQSIQSTFDTLLQAFGR